MDLTMSSFSKLITLAAIVVVFAIAGWRLGAPQSFQTALAETGIVAQAPVIAAPAAPAPEAPAPTPSTTPAQPQGDSSAGH